MLKKLLDLFDFKKAQREFNAKKQILVVDDSDLDRTLVVRLLKRQGYQVITAENGEKALEMIFVNQPDLVILDCEMPVMSGLETCRKLKENKEYNHIPVLFLTSVDTPKNIIDCFDVDAENFLNKPVDLGILTSQIKMILSMART